MRRQCKERRSERVPLGGDGREAGCSWSTFSSVCIVVQRCQKPTRINMKIFVGRWQVQKREEVIAELEHLLFRDLDALLMTCTAAGVIFAVTTFLTRTCTAMDDPPAACECKWSSLL